MKNILFKLLFVLLLVLSVTFMACGTEEKEPEPEKDPDPVTEPIEDEPTEEPPSEEIDFSIINEYILKLFNNLEISEDIDLPTEIAALKAKLEWIYDSPYLVDGKFNPPAVDEELMTKVIITFMGVKEELDVLFKLKGSNKYTLEDVEAYLMDNYDGLEISSDIEFPLYLDEFGASLIWESGEDEYLTSEGKFTAPILDLENDLFVTIILNGKRKEVDLTVTLKGWGTEMDVIKDWVNKQIPKELTTSIRLPISHNRYKSTLSWTSSDEAHMTSEGYITKDPDNDIEVTLTCNIEYNGEKDTVTVKTKVLKLSNSEKNFEVKDWLDSLFSDVEEVNGDINLPIVYEKYGAKITWKSNSPGIITESGKYNIPISDRVVSLVATSTIGDSTVSMTYSFKTYGKQISDVWEGVNKILSYIALEHITNFTYITYGGQAGYERNKVQEYGYLLFVTQDKSVITDRMLDYTYGHCRTGIKKTSTEYIVIHDTWNTSPSAGALAHANYLSNINDDPNGDYISWHFVIDEDYAVQQLPLDEVAYHAGDGSHVYGDTYYNTTYKYQSIGGGNRNGIGIETCVNFGTNYTNVMRRCAKLVAELLIDYNLGLERVKQHHDFSGKDCPCVMRNNNRWEEFLNMVEIFYYCKTVLKDVTFKWTSLSPTILDNEGHIINHPGEETVVRYKVEVTYLGETKTFEFSSIVDALK